MSKTILALLLVAVALPSMAAENAEPSGALLGFKSSKNVTTRYSTDGTPSDRWSGASGHSAGDKNYATSSGYGGMAQKVVAPGDAVVAPAAPGTSTDSAVPSGYTSM
jgi:hypothetical protein